jgi:hypothetical protein
MFPAINNHFSGKIPLVYAGNLLSLYHIPILYRRQLPKKQNMKEKNYKLAEWKEMLERYCGMANRRQYLKGMKNHFDWKLFYFIIPLQFSSQHMAGSSG